MDSYIYQRLLDSAWYEGRRKDVSYIIDEMKEQELTIPNEAIIKVIEEFIYVDLEFKTPDEKFGNIRFNVEDANNFVSSRMLQNYEKVTGESLVAIATIYFDNGILFMSYTSNFYMVHEGGFFKVGNTFEEMLNTIFYQKDIYRYNAIV